MARIEGKTITSDDGSWKMEPDEVLPEILCFYWRNDDGTWGGGLGADGYSWSEKDGLTTDTDFPIEPSDWARWERDEPAWAAFLREVERWAPSAVAEARAARPEWMIRALNCGWRYPDDEADVDPWVHEALRHGWRPPDIGKPGDGQA